MKLRPYQQESVDKVIKGFETFDRQLLVLPTGSGKTICFSFLAQKLLPKKTLILAHREELIDQAIDKLHRATGIFAGKEKAEWRASKNDGVVVGSIQSMINRLDNWSPQHFGLVVVDESHRALAESYQRVLKHFTGAKVLGVTATPDRGDKRNLGEYFENIAHEVGLFELINQGFLCPITLKAIPLKISLDGVEQKNGDFDATGLGAALMPYMDGIADAIKTHASERKTLVFLPLIATSKAFTAVCERKGIRARHVDGYSDDRKQLLAQFGRGDFDLLNNSMLVVEGYDEPSVSCVVNLRPTRSRPLAAQIVGRGTRLCDGKKDLLLLDFLFTHERLSLVKPAHLIAQTEEEAEAITKKALQKTGGETQEALDLQGLATACREEREETLRKKLAALADRKAKFISAEQFALNNHRLEVAEWQPTMKWHEEAISAPQAEWIEKAGVNPETVRGKGHASEILNIFFAKRKQEAASHKQRWAMKCAGWVSPDGLRGPFQATRDDAIKFFASRSPKPAPKPAATKQESFQYNWRESH